MSAVITEAVIPLGKPYDPAVRREDLHGAFSRALAEAGAVGATRITIAFPRGFNASTALAEARRLTGFDVIDVHPGASEQPLPTAPSGIISWQGEEPSWDHMVATALRGCRKRTVVLIDPTLALPEMGRASTAGIARLTQATRGRRQAVLGTVHLPWERALEMPVLQPNGTAGGVNVRFDRRGDAQDDGLTVFAGLAILPSSITLDDEEVNWPQAYRFPGETLLQAVGRPGNRTIACDLTHIASTPSAAAELSSKTLILQHPTFPVS